MRILAAAVLVGVMTTAGAAAAQKKAKASRESEQAILRVGVATRVFHPTEPRNWRGEEAKELRCIVWYPAVDTAAEVRQVVGPPDAPLFEAGMASPRAEFAPSLRRSPLILLSHGSGGSAIQMAWLGTELARSGYIAVAVDHPGNNSVDPLTPEGMALWWERATDLGDVLDAMLKEAVFGEHIDPTRVAAAGYSLGGYTMMELAGARTDISAFFDMCHAKPDSGVCQTREARGLGTPEEILQATRKTSGESLARSSESYRDPRIKAVFAVAPALGFTLTPESLRAIRVPVEIVVGDADLTAPPRDNADYIRANVRGARETVLPGVSHYTFLDACTAQGKDKLKAYCTDEGGVDRAAVHAQVATMAVTFFDRALKLR